MQFYVEDEKNDLGDFKKGTEQCNQYKSEDGYHHNGADGKNRAVFKKVFW